MGLSKNQRDSWYPQVASKQFGEFCLGCGISKENTNEGKLLIDHINNNDKDNRLDNFQLLCRSCNRIKNPSKPKTFEREMTPEMIKNSRGEPMFRNWFAGKVLEHRHYSYEHAISSGAEFCGLSTETTKRYLRKMLSPDGHYELGWATGGEVHIYEKGDAPEQDDPFGHTK